jgi:hypothetical protein
MKIIHILGSAAAILGVVIPMNAWAQQVGVYNGTTADGDNVSFTVGLDNNNDLAITGAGISFTATCAATGDIVNEDWGFGTDEVISGTRAPFAAGDEYFYIFAPGTVLFHGSQLTGHLNSRTAIFRTNTTPPGGAQYCISPTQSFTATFSGPSHFPALPVGTAVKVSRTNGPGDVIPANR